MRYAAVYLPDGTISEIRTSDSPPSYTPPDCEWVDVGSSTLSDQQLIGSHWDGAQIVPKIQPLNLDPDFDLGPSIAEIIGE
jgi:hypothetical protein